MPIYEDTESYIPRLYVGPLAERPSVGVKGRIWLADDGSMSFDDGVSAWRDIGGDGAAGVFSPLAYGATGGADDSAAFQACLDAAYLYVDETDTVAYHGGLVVIPPGMWKVNNLTFKAGVQIEGAGPGTTTLKRPSGGGQTYAVLRSYDWENGAFPASYHWNFGISNLTIDGNYGQYGVDARGSGVGGGGLFIKNSDSYRIHNVHIVHCKDPGLWVVASHAGSSSYGIGQDGGQPRFHDMNIGNCYGENDYGLANLYGEPSVLLGGGTDQNFINFDIWHKDTTDDGGDRVGLALAVGGHKVMGFHIWGEGFKRHLYVPSSNNQVKGFHIESHNQVAASACMIHVAASNNEIEGHIYGNVADNTTQNGLKLTGSCQGNQINLFQSNVRGKGFEQGTATLTGSHIRIRASRGATSTDPTSFTAPGTAYVGDATYDIQWYHNTGRGGFYQPMATGTAYVTKIAQDWTFDASVGPVIRSPDGTKYRVVVANGGALSTTAV